MDYINIEGVKKVVPAEDILVSSRYSQYITDVNNVLKGFYIKFTTSEVDINSSNIESADAGIGLEGSFSTEWVPVFTTRTISGFEIYLSNEQLPRDYSERDEGKEEGKYKTVFLGFKDMITDRTHPLLCFHIVPESIVYDVNTTITFDSDIKCNFLMNSAPNLEHLNILEYDPQHEEDKYNKIDMVNQLLSYRKDGGISSSSYRGGTLKY